MRVGFSTASLVPAVQERQGVHDPLLARTLVVCGGRRIELVLAALDLLNLEGERARVLRREVARRFDLPEHRVVLHVTHTHSAPNQHRLDLQALGAAVAASVRRAQAAARPARVAFLQADASRDFSRCRRWDGGPGIGTVTVIDNSGCVFKDGEVYVKNHVQAELERIGHGATPIPDDALLDGAVDRDLTLLHFVDGRGRSLGGIARFAVHPDQVAARGGMVLSAEFPGYVCRRLQRALGGTFLFLNGPCADLKPYYQEHTWASCRRLGAGLADRLLALRPPRRAYRPLTSVKVYADQLHLAARTDVEQDLGKLVTQCFELRARERTLGAMPLRKARALYERRWLLDTLVYLAGAFHDGDPRPMFAPRPCLLALLSFNGVAEYLCLPDEQFAEMTRRIRAGCRNRPHLQTVSLCNGAGWYLPPAEEIAKGGYEPTFAISAPGSFDAVARTAVALARRAARGGREVWTAQALARQLTRAGVRPGDTLLVHSALRGCGYVEGGVEAILRALLLAVGRTGTLVLPTLTGSRLDHPDHPPTFDRCHTPCWTGALPQHALARPEAVRSFHPTHSCVAIGPRALEMTRDHERSLTPVDALSPYQKVVQQGGKILIMGLDLRCLTLVHGAEEMRRRPDPCHARPCRCLMIDGPRRELRPYRLHDWSVVPRDYETFRPALERAKAIRPLRIGDAASWLLDAARAWPVLCRAVGRA